MMPMNLDSQQQTIAAASLPDAFSTKDGIKAANERLVSEVLLAQDMDTPRRGKRAKGVQMKRLPIEKVLFS